MNNTKKIFPILLVILFMLTLSKQNFSEEFKIFKKTSFSVMTGYFIPSESSYKKIYGNRNFPISVSFSLEISKITGLSLGYRFIKSSGETIILGPKLFEEHYSLTLTNHTFFVNLFIFYTGSRFKPKFEIGLNLSDYSEKWKEINISTENQKFGYNTAFSVESSLSRKISCIVKLQYLSISTPSQSKIKEKINLGGIETLLGICYYF
ncbi:MAG: hypothetical protein AB1410_06980 [Acidobacteriota bacterium]